MPVDWSDFLVPHWGVINLHHVPLLPNPYLPHTHRQHPTKGNATPYVTLVFCGGFLVNFKAFPQREWSFTYPDTPNDAHALEKYLQYYIVQVAVLFEHY
jgi:hypothetical protein